MNESLMKNSKNSAKQKAAAGRRQTRRHPHWSSMPTLEPSSACLIGVGLSICTPQTPTVPTRLDKNVPAPGAVKQFPLTKGTTAVRSRPGVVLQKGKPEHQLERNAKRPQHFRLPFASLYDNPHAFGRLF